LNVDQEHPAEQWWTQVNSASEFNPHKVSPIVLYRDKNHTEIEDMHMIALDGHHNLLTTQLLLISLRDAALSLFQMPGG
jgi:hypothetical protein